MRIDLIYDEVNQRFKFDAGDRDGWIPYGACPQGIVLRYEHRNVLRSIAGDITAEVQVWVQGVTTINDPEEFETPW